MTTDLNRWLIRQQITQEQCEALTPQEQRQRMVRHRGTAPSTMLTTPPRGNTKSMKSRARWWTTMLMLHADVVTVPLDPPDSLVIRSETLITCPHATHGPDGCATGCIQYTGRGHRRKDGQINPVHLGQLKRTQFLRQDPVAFLAVLDREIGLASARARAEGVQPAVRLNGLSDLIWERIAPWLFTKHHDASFYDYTKWPIHVRVDERLPANYHLAYSSQAHIHRTWDQVETLLRFGYKVAAIVDDVDAWMSHPLAVRADESDQWMIESDKPLGLLRAKHPLLPTDGSVWQS